MRLEEILRTDDGPVLRLRNMYRPDDTHMADEYARSVAYTFIFWTEEIVRMYLPEEGQRLARPGMDIIAGQAWVTAQSGGDTASLEEWTDVGEDRFFVTQVYDSDDRTFAPLPVAKVSMLLAYNDKYHAPKLEKIEPLACLDIFAGCGGLSQGLHEAGVIVPTWAVEEWTPAASSFSKNNPKECLQNNNWLNIGLLLTEPYQILFLKLYNNFKLVQTSELGELSQD